MPKERVYIKVKGAAIQVRSTYNDKLEKEYADTPQNMMLAMTIANHQNNSRELDNITLRIAEHMRRIKQEHKIPEGFFPVRNQVVTRIVS